MTEAPTTDLVHFLAEEFARNNIAVSDSVTLVPLIGDWSLRRDDAGFVITAKPEAHSQLKSMLETIFTEPKFDSHDTLIYRNDAKHVTAMLNRGTDETALIVLLWADPEVRSRIADAQNDAITKVTDDAAAEIYQLLEKASLETDGAKQSELFDKAQRMIEEFRSTVDGIDKFEPQIEQTDEPEPFGLGEFP